MRVTKSLGNRQYDILVPANHNGILVFALSGWGQKLKKTRPKMFDFPRMTNFDLLAAERRYVLVYPHAQGFLPRWNLKTFDDLSFCSKLLGSIIVNYDIEKVIGCGFSQGGVVLQALEEITPFNFNSLIIHSSGGLEEGLKVYKSDLKIERSKHTSKKHPEKVIAALGDKDKILGRKGLQRLDDIINRFSKRGCKTYEYCLNEVGHEWDSSKNDEWFDLLES